ncbi:MAG TPA: leucyl aminopeptidase [Planctomycetota bacterium]
MKLRIEDPKRALPKGDLLCVLGLQGEPHGLPAGVRVPELALSAFQGEFRETRLTDCLAGPAARFLQVGLGKRAEADHERLRRAAAIAARKAEKVRAKTLVLWIEPAVARLAGGPERAAQALAEGVVLASHALRSFKSKPKGPYLAEVVLCGPGPDFRRGAARGELVGRANTFARRLQDTPANRMRPRDLVTEARALVRGDRRFALRVFDESGLARLGMGAFLSVARGSEEPAYLIHLSHRPRTRARERLALVGKGLTFDAGGISLKPSAKMEEMKYDMSGAAAVLGVFQALRGLDLPLEVHGVIAATENLPDGCANKPGDLVTAMNGTTIEILNTDAEGRLVLADALVYVERRLRPAAIVDLATLTGAVITALGHELTGVMGTDEPLRDELIAAGKATGELVWPLPLLDQHREHMKGAVADLKNINSGQGAGSSAGAAFLAHFVEKTPWAHLDIAGTAWGVDERDYQGGSGGTGVGVRLLLAWLEGRAARAGAAPRARQTSAKA